MTINYGTTGKDRKNLVAALAEALGETTTYCGAPSFAYTVGNDYRVDREGTLTGPDNSSLISALQDRGFTPTDFHWDADTTSEPATPENAPEIPGEATDDIAAYLPPAEPETEAEIETAKPDKTFYLITPRGTLLCQERFDTAAEAEAAGYGEYFHHEGRDVYIKPAPDGKTEHSKHFAVVGAPFEQAPEADEPEEDCVCIEMPLNGFTPEKLDNLSKMVAAKEALITQALGIDGPLAIQVLEDRIAFPWFKGTVDGAHIDAYAQLIAAICRTAKEKTRVTAQPKEEHPNPRFTMRCWLISLGLVGPEYRLIRKIMTSTLCGNGAWSTGIDPRKVERDAAKAAQAEAAAEETTTEIEVAGENISGDFLSAEESEVTANE